MTYSFSTKPGAGHSETIPTSRDLTGYTLTAEFSADSSFSSVTAKSATGTGKNVDLSLTAADADSLKDTYYRIKAVKDGKTTYVQTGVIDYVVPKSDGSLTIDKVVNDPAMRAAFAGRGELVYNVKDYGAKGDGVTDDTAAINAAISALPAIAGSFSAASGVLFFPAGRYLTRGGHVIPSTKRIHVRGTGRYNSFLYKIAGSAPADLLTFNGGFTGVSAMSLNGDSSAVSGDVVVLNAQSCYVNDVFISGAGGNGVTIGKAASGINSELAALVIRYCNGYGVEVVASSGSTDCAWVNVNIGNTGLAGARIAAGANLLSNVHVWGAGIAGSGTNRDGFRLASGQNTLTGCEAETNLGFGVYIESGCNGNQVLGGDYWGNYSGGIYGFNCKRTSIVGARTRQNGVGNTAGSASTGFSGIVNESGTDWVLSGNISWDDGVAIPAGAYNGTAPANPYTGRAAGPFTQTYAYVETNNGGTSPDRQTITGNSWRRQDHKSGAVQTVGVSSVWSGNNLGNETLPTTPSAATISVPPKFDLVNVTGTATVTSITASWTGRRITLWFSNATPGGLTDGGNLLLAGNFAPTGNDTITLICDGANWIETGRSGDI